MKIYNSKDKAGKIMKWSARDIVKLGMDIEGDNYLDSMILS